MTTLRFLIALILLTGLSLTWLAGSSAAPKPKATQQQIEKVLRHHEAMRLDAADTARQVRQTGRLQLATASQRFSLELTPNDLRAPNYRAEEVLANGDGHAVDMSAAPVHTYRGTVQGMNGTEARFTIDDQKVEGVIITGGERYYLEPQRNYSAQATANDYIFYKGSDVIEGALGTCATMDSKLRSEVHRLASKVEQATAVSSYKQVELATEADYEYVNFFGGSSAANTEIINIMNQVDGLYRSEMGVTFQIVYQHSWTADNDPYSSTVSDSILTEFTNYWNANITQARDMAHMWTGKQMDGNIVGIAWLGTLCQYSATYAYGVSERLTSAVKAATTAHEIGHNLGASHPDQATPPVPACSTTVMNSFVGSNFTLCQFSRDEINAYLAGNSGCLTIVSSSANAQFSASNYPVNEGGGSVTITITRTGDTSSAASVDYATSNGSAMVNSDYAAASGTVQFAAGQASQTFPVFIIDDAYVESAQTINLSLSNAIGVALGSPASATVTINDNDSSSTGNPLDTHAFFVRQHYLDFLGRDADQGGLDYWVSTLTACGGNSACLNSQHTTVSAAFFVESEFQDTGYYVYRVYKAAFGRRPVFDEFAADRGRVVGNPDLAASKQALAADFVSRAPFTVQYPASLTPELYVDQLNTNTGNSLTQSERDALVNGLKNSSETRASVLRQVAENQLFRQREYNAAFVSMQYFGYLRRDPDSGGFNFWLGVLNNSSPLNFRGMVCSFLTSAEYQLRFSPVVTRGNSECQ